MTMNSKRDLRSSLVFLYEKAYFGDKPDRVHVMNELSDALSHLARGYKEQAVDILMKHGGYQ